MSAVAMRLGLLRKYIKEEPRADELITTIEKSVSDSIGRLRRLMFSLRPPALDRDGLEAALRDHLQVAGDECGFSWDVACTFVVEPSTALRVNVYRIVQEAVANVRKHADASSVSVEVMSANAGLFVAIRDDGRGFAAEKDQRSARGHLGITSMRERAELAGGWCKITSAPGSGTRVEFWMPDRPSSLSEDDDELGSRLAS